jgi:hypothetical protein
MDKADPRRPRHILEMTPPDSMIQELCRPVCGEALSSPGIRAALSLVCLARWAHQFVYDPSGRVNMGIGRERSVISAASLSGFVSSVTPSPGRRFGHILPLRKS